MSADIDATHELARVLEALGSQLSDSVQESAREWAEVGAAFDRLSAANTRLGALREASPTAIHGETEEIRASLGAAVVALQHHDRLAQRLGHIRSGIDDLRDLLTSGVERSSSEWRMRLQAVERMQHDAHARLVAVDSVPRGSVELF
ncbi:MAG: hypothetical protein ABSC32_03140 [Steroidobacteraceae bacterium]|jgi:hypothetical protein